MRSISSLVLAAGVYPPDVGGPATYAAMIASELPKQGIAVTVQPFHTVRSVPKLVRHMVYTYHLYRAARDADAVMATDGVSVGLPAWVVARVRGVPLVVRLGGDYAWEQGVQRCGIEDTLDEFTSKTPQSYCLLVRMLAAVQRFVVSRADRVVVPSEYLKHIVATWPGVTPDTIEVIYSVLTSLPPASVEREEGYAFTIVTAGRLVPWKGVDGLIRVVSGLPDAHLVVLGDGPERVRLEALANTLQAAERVSFLGSCDKQTVSNQLAQADVFVLNTAYEGLSHMLLEVMGAGVPIITTAVGGNPELVQDGVSGRLVLWGDEEALEEAIKDVRKDPAAAARLAAAAKEQTAQFTTARSVAALKELLQSYGT